MVISGLSLRQSEDLQGIILLPSYCQIKLSKSLTVDTETELYHAEIKLYTECLLMECISTSRSLFQYLSLYSSAVILSTL